MDGGRWEESAGRVRLALAAIAENRMDDYSTSVLAFAAVLMSEKLRRTDTSSTGY